MLPTEVSDAQTAKMVATPSHQTPERLFSLNIRHVHCSVRCSWTCRICTLLDSPSYSVLLTVLSPPCWLAASAFNKIPQLGIQQKPCSILCHT